MSLNIEVNLDLCFMFTFDSMIMIHNFKINISNMLAVSSHVHYVEIFITMFKKRERGKLDSDFDVNIFSNHFYLMRVTVITQVNM